MVGELLGCGAFFEAEAIYDSGREACVGFLIGLAAGQRRLEERLRALEAKTAASSRNSSQPPSTDAPMTRQQRRQEARDKAKELARKDGQRRKAGGQDGHPGAGRELLAEDQMQEIVDHYPEECSGCGRQFTDAERVPRHGPGRHQVGPRGGPTLHIGAAICVILILWLINRANRMGLTVDQYDIIVFGPLKARHLKWSEVAGFSTHRWSVNMIVDLKLVTAEH